MHGMVIIEATDTLDFELILHVDNPGNFPHTILGQSFQRTGRNFTFQYQDPMIHFNFKIPTINAAILGKVPDGFLEDEFIRPWMMVDKGMLKSYFLMPFHALIVALMT
jgi:hypothetical protein